MERFETIFEILDSAFLKKIEVKGGRCVKKWEFGKKKIFLRYQLFIRFNSEMGKLIIKRYTVPLWRTVRAIRETLGKLRDQFYSVFFSLSTNSILEPVEASHFCHSDGATELLDVQGD